jgi:WD40 repeat protein
MELEHAIGFGGVSAGLHYLPDGENYIYAAGGCIVMCNFDDPHKQFFLRGHDQNVTCMSISKSGRYLASGQYGENADVIVWDLQSKQLLYRLSHHDTGIACVAFSDDELLLASVGDPKDDKKMFIWDLRTGNIVSVANVGVATTAVCWGGMVRNVKRRDTDLYQLATGGDKAIFLWSLDPYQGELQHEKVQQQQMRQITCLVFSADLWTIYAGTTTGDFMVVDVRSKKTLGHCNTCSSGVLSIGCFRSEDGADMLMAGGGDGSITSLETNKEGDTRVVATGYLPGGVIALSFSPNQLEVVAGTSQGFVYRLRTAADPSSPGQLHPLLVSENHYAPVAAVAYDPDSSDFFATISLDRTIRVWDASDYSVKVKSVVEVSAQVIPSSLSYSPDVMISGWSDGVIRGYCPNTGEYLWHIDDAHKGGVTSLLLSNNQRFIMSGGAEGEVRVWELRSRELVSHLKEHSSPVTGLALFDDDAHALSCSRDRSFLCWDLRQEKRISNHTQRMGGINDVTLSRSQTKVLTIGQEKKITYWDLREPTPERVLEYYPRSGPDATSQVAGGLDAVHAEATCIAVSSNGRVFATGGTDARVKLWDFETGALIVNGLGHSASVASLHFSPDDRQLVSVGADGCVFVWNIYEL